MKRLLLLVALFCMAGMPCVAADSHFEQLLRRLDPGTRLEQLCDFAAIQQIDRDRNSFHPDRAVGNALIDSKVKADTIEAKGAAFRSGGKWYQFAFTCRASPDHMKVLSFEYQIGAAIPEDKWESYGLWR